MYRFGGRWRVCRHEVDTTAKIFLLSRSRDRYLVTDGPLDRLVSPLRAARPSVASCVLLGLKLRDVARQEREGKKRESNNFPIHCTYTNNRARTRQKLQLTIIISFGGIYCFFLLPSTGLMAHNPQEGDPAALGGM